MARRSVSVLQRVAVILSGLLLLSPAAQGGAESELLLDTASEELTSMALGDIPARVLSAARDAAPDVAFTSAERYWEQDVLVYRISARLYREAWNVFVREDGVVLRTESDNTAN